MSGSLRSFSFLLFLLAGFTHLASASTPDEVAARRAFLWDLKERVIPVLDINKVHALTIQSCLNQTAEAEFDSLSIANVNLKSRWSDCRSSLGLIRENIRLNYSAVRRALFLSQIFDGANIDLLLINLRANVINKNANQPPLGVSFGKPSLFSFGLGIDNPLVFTLNREEVPYPEWTNREVSTAIGDENGKNADNAGLETFNSIFRKTCHKLNDEAKGKWFDLRFSFCDDVYLSVGPDAQQLFFNYRGSLKDLRATLNEIEISRTFLREALRGQANKWTEEFKALVQLHPYVGLVSSAKPKRSELAIAYKIITERAEKTVSDFSELAEKKQLNSYSKADATALLRLMKYNPIAKSLVDRPGVELTKHLKTHPYFDVETLFKELMSDFHWQEMKDLGWDIAKVSAANAVLCWLPIARGPKVLGTVIYSLTKLERFSEILAASFTPICYGVGGGLINIGFLWSSYREYTDIYNEVFSSFEKESMVREINDLTDKEREIFWSTLTVPVGTGLLKMGSAKVKALILKLKEKGLSLSTFPQLREVL